MTHQLYFQRNTLSSCLTLSSKDHDFLNLTSEGFDILYREQIRAPICQEHLQRKGQILSLLFLEKSHWIEDVGKGVKCLLCGHHQGLSLES